MSQRLANELGIAVGISSGANLLGALEIAHEQGDGACVVTVFCDDNKKYLSTDLCSDEECKEHYRVNDVELLDFRVIPPVTVDCSRTRVATSGCTRVSDAARHPRPLLTSASARDRRSE